MFALRYILAAAAILGALYLFVPECKQWAVASAVPVAPMQCVSR